MQPNILIGPMLRYLSATAATVWFEIDRSCSVTLTLSGERPGDPDQDGRSFTARTWSVHGHHFALLSLTDLTQDTHYTYRVACDGHPVWPVPEVEDIFGPSWIRTHRRDPTGRIVFGSCRRAAPLDGRGLAAFGADALVALAFRLRQTEPEFWPDVLMLAGDQVYADDPDEAILTRIRAIRAGDNEWAGQRMDEVAAEACSFEEYALLYEQSWTTAPLRWLFSTVSTSMILDDHDLRDDWNISAPWRDHVSRAPWWKKKVKGAFASYWVYQHIGNLSPDALTTDPTFRRILAAPNDDDRTHLLGQFALLADEEPDSARWSHYRDLGDEDHQIRIVVIDSRCSRRLEPDNRKIVDDLEFDWLRARMTEKDLAHLVVVSTLPVFLPPGIHHLEAWNAAMADGRWSGRRQRLAERLRQAVDLEHWAAFGESMTRLLELLADVATRPRPPATITLVSGDVHCSYLAAAHLPALDPARHPVWQVTVSPLRNPLNIPVRMVNRIAAKRLGGHAMRLLARTAGATPVPARWAVTDGPWFANVLGLLAFSGRSAHVTLEHAYHRAGHHLLRPTVTKELSATDSDVVDLAAAEGRPTGGHRSSGHAEARR